MSTQTTTQHSRYSLNTKMNSAADKDERKREYNRLAQRDFRRRRKEHLKNLEQAQKEQSSEQSEEIERLRYQNDEMRREIESLRTQLYGSSSSGPQSMMSMSAPLQVPVGRQYSLSPSMSVASLSGTCSPPASLSSDMMPIGTLSMTSSMIPSSMQAYADSSSMTSQPYSMVHLSGFRQGSQSSPESSGFRNATSAAVGPPFQSLNMPHGVESHSQVAGQRSSSNSSNTVLTPYDRTKARAHILKIFQPLFLDPSITTSPERHLSILRSLSDSLPAVLKPTKNQLEKAHFVGIDLLPSASLRERLLNHSSDVARSFISESGVNAADGEDLGHMIVWGDDPLNEMSWEFSRATLERWGWLLGREWVTRANFWRRQRGETALPDW